MQALTMVFVSLWIVRGGWVEALTDFKLPWGLFYPFGPDEGDTTVPPNDDGSSPVVNLKLDFPFFNTKNRQLYVNTNGAISFGATITDFTPESFPVAFRLVAPYWCDVDTTRNDGRVYYRESTDEGLLNRATQDVLLLYSSRGLYFFRASWIFVATWYNVTYYGGRTTTPVNFFQAVLVSDGRYSFAIFNYGPMTWTTGTVSGGNASTGLGGTPAQVGFNAGDSQNYFAVPDSRTASIVRIGEATNTGQRGRWMFRIDSETTEDPDVCRVEGRCRPHQVFQKSSLSCIDIAPAFGCPSIEGPTVIDRLWIEFYCVIRTNTTDPTARFNVTFLFDGVPAPDVPQFIVTLAEGKATLHEMYLYGLLGKWISCSVSSYWDAFDGNTVYSQVLTSQNGVRTGIQFSSDVITVYEGNYRTAQLTLTPMLPITCMTLDTKSGSPKDCYLSFKVITSDDIAIRQRNGSLSCSFTLTETSWNSKLDLYAKNDPFSTSRRVNTLSVRVGKLPRKANSNGEYYINPWQDYVSSNVSVYHVDSPVAVCRATGDPNLNTFNHVYYAIYAIGQFTYVQTTRGLPIEVQVRHWPCDEVVTCVCGVAVREGNLILAADMCTDRRMHYLTFNNPLPQGASITTSQGSSFQINTPSGVKVLGYLRSWGMNIEIYVTAAEYGRVEGLCGSFDGDSTNDLKVKGTGEVVTSAQNTSSLVGVVKSWSIPLGQSLFDGYLSKVQEDKTLDSVCDCGQNSNTCGADVLNGGQAADGLFVGQRNRKTLIPGIPWTSISQLFPEQTERATNSPKAVMPDNIDYDYRSLSPMFNGSFVSFGSNVIRNWPTWNSITEGQARNHCMAVLWNNLTTTVRRLCQNRISTEDLNGIIYKCLSDIRMTGDLSWAYDKITEIQNQCLLGIIASNNTLVNNSGDITIPGLINAINEVTDDICLPQDCSGHGACVKGNCNCNSIGVGPACDTYRESVPIIIRVLDITSCDVRSFYHCQYFRLLTQRTVDVPTLSCKFDAIREDGSRWIYYTNVTQVSPNQTDCQLPRRAITSFSVGLDATMSAPTFDYLPLGSPVVHYNISISNDNRTFSNEQSVVVYDSQCYECQGLSCYPKKTSDSCIIKQYCYAGGDRNPYSTECEECNTTKSRSAWTKLFNSSCASNTGDVSFGAYLNASRSDLSSLLHFNDLLANRQMRYSLFFNRFVTRSGINQYLYMEICAGILPQRTAQLRTSGGYPILSFDWLSSSHSGSDSGCRGSVLLVGTFVSGSLSQQGGGVYSSPDQRETSWSTFSVTDTMKYGSHLLSVYGASSVSGYGALPMQNPTVHPISPYRIYNAATTSYLCRSPSQAYFFSMSVGVPAGGAATVRLALAGQTYAPEITRRNSNTDGTTTLARSVLLPCNREARLVLVDGQVVAMGRLISLTAFPYELQNGESVAWAGYRTSNVTAAGMITFDLWLVQIGTSFSATNSTVIIPIRGYYYVYLSAGIHPGRGVSMSLMKNGQSLFGLTRTATDHDGQDIIGHGMVTFLSADDLLRVDAGTSAYSTSIGLHTSFFGMLLYTA